MDTNKSLSNDCLSSTVDVEVRYDCVTKKSSYSCIANDILISVVASSSTDVFLAFIYYYISR